MIELDYWLTGTTPWWTLTALVYCLGAVHLRAFDRYEHPPWVWGTFLMIGSAIFLIINHGHVAANDPLTASVVEWFAIVALTVGCVVLFWLSRSWARERETRAELESKIGHYRELVDDEAGYDYGDDTATAETDPATADGEREHNGRNRN